jgi:Sigma-70, region 4
LYRIAANAAYQKVRAMKGRRHERSLDETLLGFDQYGQHAQAIADWSPRVQDAAVQTELRAVLTGAIEELPADYRTVLVLRDIEGLSNLEIGEALEPQRRQREVSCPSRAAVSAQAAGRLRGHAARKRGISRVGPRRPSCLRSDFAVCRAALSGSRRRRDRENAAGSQRWLSAAEALPSSDGTSIPCDETGLDRRAATDDERGLSALLATVERPE